MSQDKEEGLTFEIERDVSACLVITLDMYLF